MNKSADGSGTCRRKPSPCAGPHCEGCEHLVDGPKVKKTTEKKLFTLRKVGRDGTAVKNKYVVTFSAGYFKTLLKTHPFAVNLLVTKIIEFNKEHGGKVLILDHKQEEALTKRLQTHSYNYTYAQTLLEQTFKRGFRLLDVGLERCPEVLDAVYRLIEGKKETPGEACVSSAEELRTRLLAFFKTCPDADAFDAAEELGVDIEECSAVCDELIKSGALLAGEE